MREILFRGKRKDTGAWVEGYLTKHIFAGYAESLCIEVKQIKMRYLQGTEYVYQPYEVRYETVGQYTGLNDKNGKKIFEGDVVDVESHGYIPDTSRGVVVFNNGCYAVKLKTAYGHEYYHRIGKTSEWQDMGASGTITYTYEIIGNIHDNPELLEDK